MTSWIQTKAGLQMAETIIRCLPIIKQELQSLGTIALNSNSSRISESLEKIAKDKHIMRTYAEDMLKLFDEMDIRKQENVNLKFQLDELKTRLESVLGIQFEK